LNNRIVPIGADFQQAMSLLGLDDVSKYLLYPPASYRDYRDPLRDLIEAEKLSKDGPVTLKLRVSKAPSVHSTGKGPKRVSCSMTDGVSTASFSAFGGVAGWLSALRVGQSVTLTAKVEYWNNFLQLKNPELIPIMQVGRIIPRYRGKEGVITSEEIELAFRQFAGSPLIYTTAQQILGSFPGMTEERLLYIVGSKFTSLSDLISALHMPKSREELSDVCRDARMLNAYVMLLKAKQEKKPSIPKSSAKIPDSVVADVISQIPFTPTDDQVKAINEIIGDIRSDAPMNRLLSGDVGCGKTISYAVPAVCSQKAGLTTVIILPNSLLAGQVASEIKEMFPDTPVELILGGGDRPSSIDHNPIIIGTSAVFWWVKKLKKDNPKFSVDLMIIDEQQKLGSRQKSEIMSPHTNFLEASATAIPRTLALVQYGGKSISRVEKCPVEKTILSRVVEPENKSKAAAHLMDIVSKGYQIAIVYPLKERGEEFIAFSTESKESAEKMKAALKKIGIKSAGRFITDEFEQGQLRFRVPEKLREKLESLTRKLKWVEVDPFISEKDRNFMDKNVEQALVAWEKRIPGGVVAIHGGMSTEDKVEAMRKAKAGEAKAIITTSVIEIGLTVPSLKGMIVASSDRYGASTLHQLRGRLSRHGGKGFFYMAVDAPLSEMSPDSVERLQAVEKNNNGRLLAELDMHQRGFGDISQTGEEQSGFLDGIFKGLKAYPSDIETIINLNKTRKANNISNLSGTMNP
jgi:RecG-like helicase